MRRSRRLALALSVCALGTGAIVPLAAGQTAAPGTPDAPGATPAVPSQGQTKSPFKVDREASTPTGLSPDSVSSPFAYPDQPVVLRWADVPGAVGYTVEVSANPGFTTIAWKADTVQPIAVPDVVLPDGEYWWRVKAVDQAGTVGATSDVARFAKTWPNAITGSRLAATPGGAPVSFLQLMPYMSWNPVPGAQTYDIEVSPGDQFSKTTFFGKDVHAPFATPAVVGGVPDDTYSWRVRARDPGGHAGPWTVGTSFTRSWVAPTPVSPADNAVTPSLLVSWTPVDGAQQYQVQMSDLANNFTGDNLKVNTLTSATSFAPTLAEQNAKSLGFGDVYWRVRPVINDGIFGTWSPQRHIDFQATGPTTATAVLSSSGDTVTGLSPELTWSRVTGANIYRVDIAADPQFNTVVESQITTAQGWASRKPLPDNQVGTGYYWRVVWGSGTTEFAPHWMVDEAIVDSAQFKKQTQVVLGSAAGGQLVTAAPLLTWSSVPGIARYEVQLSSNGKFADDDATRKAIVFGTGVVPGSMFNDEKRLPDGTWSWRVRAIDGSGDGQTWSPVGTFTLTQPRPVQDEPNDGAVAVFSPLITWSAVPGACGYQVAVSRDPAFKESSSDDLQKTAQTALVPPKGVVTTPGKHYWRVRADYCDGGTGQWSPTRSFRSVFPPSFNLNSIPNRVDYDRTVLVAGQLRNNGAAVKSARLYLERRLWPSDTYRPAGTIRTNTAGRFRFALRMKRSSDYRLVWRESATNPEGVASFGIDVQPRVTFRLASSRVVRKSGLLVKGSVYPRRPALVQLKTSDGWQTVKKVKPSRARFAVAVSTTRLTPGIQRLRLFVPRDAQRKFANASSRQRGVLIYDKFVIRGGR
jgi:hypothetical protein